MCCEFASVAVTAMRDAPLEQTDVTIQSAEYGLSKITVIGAENCTVEIPRFGKGTTAPISCTATKLDPGHPARATFLATVPHTQGGMDTLGDAVVTRLRLNTGGWAAQTFKGMPKQQGLITIQNGSPGLQTLQVSVNNTVYELTLTDNQVATIDVSASMLGKDTNNTISLQGYGALGADAVISIGQKTQPSIPLPDGWQNSPARENWIWGNLIKVVEKMSSSGISLSTDQTVQVGFDGPLDPASASDPSLFSVDVSVSGTIQTVQPSGASYDASTLIVTLSLPDETFQAGSEVTAYWDGLLTAEQLTLNGCTQEMTAQ